MTAEFDQVIQTVLKSEDLPTLPTVASQLLILTAKEDTTLSDIGNLVSHDMALSSKILKVSNSAFYSFPQQISSINQAVSILGINAVRSLVLSFSFLSMKGAKSTTFNFKEFWERSLSGAVAAKLILEQVEGSDTEEIFIAGLLRNLGQLIMASTLSGQYEQVLKKKLQEDIDEEKIEVELLGATHSQVGYKVAEFWGFPEKLLLPILYHAHPDEYSGKDVHVSQTIGAIYLADLIVQILHSKNPETHHKKFRKKAKQLLGLKVIKINKILSQIHKAVNQTAKDVGLKIKHSKSVEEILQEANMRLSLINMSYEEMNRELVSSKIKLEKLTRELENKNKFLENLANIDGLTEVHNHRFFQNFLDKEINRSIRNSKPISILLADIDHFKKFNDTYGHQTGDFILKEFCRVTKENIREYDILARYGGEEFVYVLPETDTDDALKVAEKLRAFVADHEFDDDENIYSVTISIGVTSAKPTGSGFQKNQFIGFADEALYEAKNKGRNRVVLYTPKKKQWFKF